MKIKTDIYTKIVLTVIAIALTGLLIKDIDLITKVNAAEPDLSVINIEKAQSDEERTFYIYENDKLFGGFGKSEYTDDYNTSTPWIRKKDYNTEKKKAYINNYYDMPQYIITTKKGSFWLER